MPPKSQISSNNMPPWEVLNLVAHHLDPKTLAIASCVGKSWLSSMSSDHLWQLICDAHYPSLSNLKLAYPSVPYCRLYSIGHSANKRRLKQPPKPRISIDDLIFAIDLRATPEDVPFFTIAKPANKLCADPNGVFRFDVNVDDYKGLGVVEQPKEVTITWNVVLTGWQGAFTMMDCEGKLSSTQEVEGWFSEELPSSGCCFSDVASGVVADLKLGLCGGRESGGQVRVDKVSVGMLSTVSWRYVSVDDGLRYLQHFLVQSAGI